MKKFLPVFFILILLSCGHSEPSVPSEILIVPPEVVEAPSEAPSEIPSEAPPPPPPVRYSLTLVAAGDNLFHETIFATSLVKSGGQETYNFAPIYDNVKPLIKKADLAFINQETVMAGERFGYSGYPRFNTPQALANNLAEAGFNIINQANNHAMDMEEAGLFATLDLWDTIQGITVIGAQRTEEKHKIITKNNITLGFLSYTYGLNGLRLPPDKPWLVSLINKETMAAEIDALHQLCDFLIVSMHWGNEYEMQPSPQQKDLAAFLAQHNVDLIIGHHPHVLQPFEYLPRSDGKNTLCFYSLGNFVSHQRNRERILGALLYVKFNKEDGNLFISDEGLIPVVCHFDRSYANTSVYPLYSYSEELLETHRVRAIDQTLTFDFFHSVLNGLQTKMIMNDPF